MKVAYIAGPYRSKDGPNGILNNIYRARQIALKYWKLGYAVICPHMNTAFMDGAEADQIWLDGDLEILRRCDVVVMTPGWRESQGAVREFFEAKIWGIKIIYEDEKEEDTNYSYTSNRAPRNLL